MAKNHFWQTFCAENCADKKVTVIRKILEVRESFKSLRKSIEAEKGGTNHNVRKRACTCQRWWWYRRRNLQQVDFRDFHEESPLTKVSLEKSIVIFMVFTLPGKTGNYIPVLDRFIFFSIHFLHVDTLQSINYKV